MSRPLHDRQPPPELVRACRGPGSLAHRLNAARALRPYWPELQVIWAYSALAGEELPLAAEVVALLGEIGDQPAMDILTMAYRTAHDPRLMTKVLGELHRAPAARTHGFMRDTGALVHPDERVRAAAVSLLARLGDRSAMDAVARMLGDASPRVRANALEALGERYDGVVAARVMARFAADPHHRIRSVAIKYLLLYGVDVQERLRAMVDSADALCRGAAAWVMRGVRLTERMRGWLSRLRGDANARVAAMARTALDAGRA